VRNVEVRGVLKHIEGFQRHMDKNIKTTSLAQGMPVHKILISFEVLEYIFPNPLAVIFCSSAQFSSVFYIYKGALLSKISPCH